MLRELNEELELAEKDLSHLELRYVTLRRCNGEIRQNYYFLQTLKTKLMSIFIRVKESAGGLTCQN